MITILVISIIVSVIVGFIAGKAFETELKCEHDYKLRQNYSLLGQDSIYLQQFECSKCEKLKNVHVK